MYLHIGDNVIIDSDDLVMVINLKQIDKKRNNIFTGKIPKRSKSLILLSSHKKVFSEIGAETLRKRLEGNKSTRI